jgi:hypothetical protein
LYSIEGNENITFDEFDFSGHDFTTEYPYTLFNVFKYEDKPVPIIDNESPNPLDLTTQDFKAYIFDDRLVFTLDDLASGTDIITINLKSKTSDFQKWRNANLKENQFYLTNSYISDKNIYQIFANKDEMNITVKELYSKNIIAQFSANREDDIKFKNTPLKQEGGTSLYTSGKEKELKNNSEFFRKLWNSNIGISVYKSNVLQITFGGYREYTQGMASGSFGTSSSTISTPMGNATAASGYSYNPTFNGFNSYTTSRSMYFVGVFNKDTFEHLDGELQKNVFDKIKAYSKEIKSNISTETIFKFNNYYVFGYYDNSVKKYFMRKFEDDK